MARTWAPNGNRWILGSDKTPAYLIAKYDKGGTIEQIPLIENVRIAHPSVISLSLQIRQGRVLRHDDILSIATRLASRAMPLVVAAGNWGEFGEGTLSPLANVPWAIAVGATSDKGGVRRHPTSSIGIRGRSSKSGVTVVAYGENPFVPGTFGTSYAVPRVVAQLLNLTSFVLQIRSIDERERTGRLGGVPILQHIFVDTGFRSLDAKPTLPLPMLPRLGVNVPAVLSMIEILREKGILLNTEPSPSVIRRMLNDSARPIPGVDSSEVGAGFVSQETTLDYLRNLDALQFTELFAHKRLLDDSTRHRLRQLALADGPRLGALSQLTLRSCLTLAIDYRTGGIHGSMRDPAMAKGERGFTKEQSQYSWPPPLQSTTDNPRRRRVCTDSNVLQRKTEAVRHKAKRR